MVRTSVKRFPAHRKQSGFGQQGVGSLVCFKSLSPEVAAYLIKCGEEYANLSNSDRRGWKGRDLIETAACVSNLRFDRGLLKRVAHDTACKEMLRQIAKQGCNGTQ